MTPIDPKSLFQSDDAKRAEAFKVTHTPRFEEQVVYVMSHYALQCPSQERLKGAIEFMELLVEFGVKEQPKASLPDKSLNQDVMRTEALQSPFKPKV